MSATLPNADPGGSFEQTKQLSRRDFLGLTGKAVLAASGVIALGELAWYMSYQPDPSPPSTFDLGSAAQYPIGSRTVIPEAHAVLLHSQDGFSVLSLVCPHLGCTLEINQESFDCPCHGSKFNTDGGLINGPANEPMQNLRAVETPDEKVILITR
jgi:cytochrome b6-f complex iron-sulfur subunit